MKKIILAAAALALAMAAPAVMPDDMVADMPFAVVAKAEGEVTEITNGTCGKENVTDVKWVLTSDGVLTISGTGDMEDYEYDTQPWNEYMGDITSVVVESGVTSIGVSAFEGCTELTAVTIPEGVTEIGGYAFYDCTGMTEITIPESVETIGDYAFCYSGITSITIPEGVSSMGDGVFNSCESLEAINVDEANANYSSVYGVLFDKDKTTFIQYPIGNTATSYTVPDDVESICNSAFECCTALTEVTISEGVTEIGGYAFYDCLGMTEITIPESVETIGDYAFCYSGITSITIPEGVSSMGDGVFNSCESLEAINVDEANENYSSVDGVLFDKDKTTFIQYPVGNTATSYTVPDDVESICDSAFYGCTSLTEVTIPDSVTEIGYYAFNGCSEIESITIGSGIAKIADCAFLDCTSLTTVIYNGTKAEWDSITISDDGNDALANATIIYVLANGECGKETVTDVTWVLTSDGTLTISGTGAMADYPSADAPWYNDYSSSITSVVIENGVTSIGDYAFADCPSLTEVTIPDSVTSISDYAFCYCEALTEITIPNSVTSIGEYAFYGCSTLDSVTIPASVTSIGTKAFPTECAVTCYADKAVVGESFGGTADYVPYVVSAEFNTVSGSQLSLPENEVYDVEEGKNVSLSIKADAKVVTIPVKITNKQEIASYTLKITDNNLVIATATGTYKDAIENIGMIQVVLGSSNDPVGAWLYMYDAEGNKIGSAEIGDPVIELPFVPAI